MYNPSWRYWSLGMGRPEYPFPLCKSSFHHGKTWWCCEPSADSQAWGVGPTGTPITTDRIEGLGQVHKENVKVLILLAALFLDLSYGEYHVDCPPVSSEGTLTLRDDIMQEVVCDTVQYDTRQDLSWNTQQRDASVIVTGCSVIFVLVQVNHVGVLEFLRH